MNHITHAVCHVSVLLLLVCTGLSAQTGDESSNANYRLRSRTRSAVVEQRVSKSYGLNGSIGESAPGLQVGTTVALSQTDVFEPSTVQVVLWLDEGWNMLSLPFDHAGTIDGLFADEYGPLSDAVLAWNAAAMRYAPLTAGIMAGQGFWLHSQGAAKIVARGTRVSLRGSPLQHGWNLIGRTWDGDDLAGATWWDGEEYQETDAMVFGVGYWYYLPLD